MKREERLTSIPPTLSIQSLKPQTLKEMFNPSKIRRFNPKNEISLIRTDEKAKKMIQRFNLKYIRYIKTKEGYEEIMELAQKIKQYIWTRLNNEYIKLKE